MTEFYTVMIGIVVLLSAFTLGYNIGRNKATNSYMDAMTRVGIEKIVYCNNTQSNWCEIVWIKK